MTQSKNIQREQTADTASPAYQQLVTDLISRVRTGQLAAFRAVNT